MRELILFRHAKTEANNAGGDRSRELTEAGRLAAADTAAALAADDVTPDLVLVSTAVRTRQTWDIAGAVFPKARVDLRDDLYDARAADIADIARSAGEGLSSLMVIGHNPGLQAYGVDLLIRGAAPPAQVETMAKGFPTGAAAIFGLDDMGRASLERLILPHR